MVINQIPTIAVKPYRTVSGHKKNGTAAAEIWPGRIWLQTLPISKLAPKLMEYMPTQHREAVQGGVVGGIVVSILDGMK